MIILLGLKAGRSVEKLLGVCEDEDGFYHCPFCAKFKSKYYFTAVKHVKSHKIGKKFIAALKPVFKVLFWVVMY